MAQSIKVFLILGAIINGEHLSQELLFAATPQAKPTMQSTPIFTEASIKAIYLLSLCFR